MLCEGQMGCISELWWNLGIVLFAGYLRRMYHRGAHCWRVCHRGCPQGGNTEAPGTKKQMQGFHMGAWISFGIGCLWIGCLWVGCLWIGCPWIGWPCRRSGQSPIYAMSIPW